MLPGREKPMRDIVYEEQIFARARVKELEEQLSRQATEAAAAQRLAAEVKARQDAVSSRVQEAQMIRLARGATMGLFAGVVSMTKSVPKLAGRIQEAVDTLSSDPAGLSRADLQNMAQLINQLVVSVNTLASTGQRVMEMDRLLLGEPTNILRAEHSNITMEEAGQRIEAGRRALEYARQEGITIDVTPTPIKDAKALSSPAAATSDDADGVNVEHLPLTQAS